MRRGGSSEGEKCEVVRGNGVVGGETHMRKQGEERPKMILGGPGDERGRKKRRLTDSM